jgi:FkbM family methyltransferase
MSIDHDYLAKRELKENDCILILGAYDGDFVKEYHEELKVKNCKVINVEPDYRNVYKCKEIDNQYGVSETYQVVLYKYNGTIEFKLRKNWLLSGVSDIPPIMPSETEEIEMLKCYTLDTFLSKHKDINVIFADIEGAELEVFLPSEKVFQMDYVAIASYHVRNNEPTYKELLKKFKGAVVLEDLEQWDSAVLYWRKENE